MYHRYFYEINKIIDTIMIIFIVTISMCCKNIILFISTKIHIDTISLSDTTQKY